MKTVSLLITSLLFACSLYAQTYINPPFEGKATAMVDIDKIQITKKHTIVYMSCESPETFIYGGWACITRTTYILDVKKKKKYPLTKVKGIPVCPKKYYFTKPGQTLRFKLYFPKLKYDVRHIHIIEDLENVQNPFNFFNVYLKPLASNDDECDKAKDIC